MATRHQDVATRHQDVATRHQDVVTRHQDVATRHQDVVTRHWPPITGKQLFWLVTHGEKSLRMTSCVKPAKHERA